MIPHRRSSLSMWVANRLAKTRLTFSREEAMREAGISHGAFLDAAERLQKRGHLVSPRRGFYVIVPPRFLSWGAPPADWYINELMQFERCPYYVGLIKAGEFYGATHQAVMEFQVVTDKRLPMLRVGRSRIVFYHRKNMAAVQRGIVDRKADNGFIKLSSVELTALDILRYPHGVAGLANIATVLTDIGGQLDGGKLASLSQAYERSVVQRLGYLLDKLGFTGPAEALNHSLSRRTPTWVELSPIRKVFSDLAPEPKERSRKWHVVMRRMPEPDW